MQQLTARERRLAPPPKLDELITKANLEPRHFNTVAHFMQENVKRCDWCKEIFEGAGWGGYCTKKHYNKAYVQKEFDYFCPICKKPFKGKKNRETCGDECKHALRAKRREEKRLALKDQIVVFNHNKKDKNAN